MLSRSVLRSGSAQLRQASTRSSNVVRHNIRQTRFNSATASGSTASSGSGSPAIAGAAAGAVAAIVVGYGLYRFSGAHTAVSSVRQVQSQWENATAKLKEKTPNDASEALKYLRDMAEHYAGFFPGGKPLLNKAFDDLDKLQETHGEEASKIVKDTYEKIKNAVGKEGLTVGTAFTVWQIIEAKFGEVEKLARAAGKNALKLHPEIADKVGGKFDDLKKLAESQGPEAKKQVDELYAKVKDIASKGLSAGSIAEITKLAQGKFDELKKAGEQAYDKGIDQLKPYLDKSPEVKKFVEENKDALKSGNVTELADAVKKAVEKNGDLSGLKEYADKAKKYLPSGAGDLSSFFEGLPSGKEIFGHFKDIQQVAKDHGEDAKQLGQKTFDEIKEILQKRAEEAKSIAEKAKKDATK